MGCLVASSLTEEEVALGEDVWALRQTFGAVAGPQLEANEPTEDCL